jgi:hypothetical protein
MSYPPVTQFETIAMETELRAQLRREQRAAGALSASVAQRTGTAGLLHWLLRARRRQPVCRAH